MKFKSLALMLLGVAAFAMVSCTSSKYKYETVANDPLNAKMYTLPNGLKVYMSVNKEQPRIQTYIAVRTGGKNDPHETTGLAHYLEHLMFKGTSQFGTQDYEAEKVLLDQITDLYELYRTKTDDGERKAIYHQIDSISYEASKLAIPNEYDKLMAMIGANGSNAFTSEDVTCYTEDIPSNQIVNWAKIQSNRFKDPVFRLFHTELEAVYEEKNMSLTNDGEKEYEALFALLFKNHSYGTQTVLGTQEHLKNPSIINIRNYFNTYYVPNNVAIILSGDFDPDNMMDIITEYFGDWKKNEELTFPTFAAEEPITEPLKAEVLGLEAENLMMGWRFPGAGSREAEILSIIGSIMNNGTAGLIDLDLNQAQKVLGVGAGAQKMADYSIFLAEGTPLPGQTLDEVRELILGEFAKLRAGDFEDELLESVKTSLKLNQQRSLERNGSRVRMFLNSFLNGPTWAEAVKTVDRQCALTKEDIVKFANEYLRDDNYAYVYKLQGVDPNIKRIEKPAITPVMSNRDAASEFLTTIKNTEVAPIEPAFLDFDKDIKKLTADKEIPVLYTKNETNGIFNLTYVYEMGSYADPVLDYIPDYIDYLGTSDMTPEQVQKAFYALGCTFSMNVGSERTSISINGLDENLAKAVALYDKVLNDVQPDNEVFASLVESLKKQRSDAKKSQSSIFRKLVSYAMYGPQYVEDQNLNDKELDAVTANELTDRIHALKNYKHRILYYGPSAESEVVKVLNENRSLAETLVETPANKKYPLLETTENVTYLAPYVANNINMTQVSNLGGTWDPTTEYGRSIFNEYFGGSMNSLVFQEMRETRGLAYSANASLTAPSKKEEPYGFRTMIATQNDKLPEALKHFNEIIEDMPVSEAAFDNAKTALIGRLRTERTVGSRILSTYLSAEDYGSNVDPRKNIFDNIQNYTIQDLIDFQQKMIKGRKYSICVVGDKPQLDLAPLKAMGPIKDVTLEEIFGY